MAEARVEGQINAPWFDATLRQAQRRLTTNGIQRRDASSGSASAYHKWHSSMIRARSGATENLPCSGQA